MLVNTRKIVYLTLAMGVACAPSSHAQLGLQVEELAPHTEANAGTRFTRLDADTSGIDFVSRVLPDHPLAFLYHSGMTANGIATGDSPWRAANAAGVW